MNIFKRNKNVEKGSKDVLDYIDEKRSMNSANYGTGSLESILTPNYEEDVFVNDNTMYDIPQINQIVKSVADEIMGMQVELKQVKGRTVTDKSSYILKKLNKRPNSYMTGGYFKKCIAIDLKLKGKAYAYINRNSNDDVESLEYIPFNNISTEDIINKSTGEKIGVKCHITRNGTSETYKQYFDDICNVMIFEYDDNIYDKGKKLLETNLRVNQYIGNKFKYGAFIDGILETAGRLSKEAATKLSESWKRLYGGSSKSGKTVVLEEGITYKQIQYDMSKMITEQITKLSDSQIEDLLVTPKGYLSSDGADEEMYFAFINKTVKPIITVIEDTLDKYLLTEDEYEDDYEFQFNVDEMSKLSPKTRNEIDSVRIQNGMASINEARYNSNLEPIDNDYMMFSLGNVFYDKDKKEFVIPNMGQTMGEGKQDNKDVDKALT